MGEAKRKLLLVVGMMLALTGPATANGTHGHPPQRVVRMGAKAVACWQTARTFLLNGIGVDYRLTSTPGLTLNCIEKYHIEITDFPEVLAQAQASKAKAMIPSTGPYEKMCYIPYPNHPETNDLALGSCNTSGATPVPPQDDSED
jgi:hypothetical protein